MEKCAKYTVIDALKWHLSYCSIVFLVRFFVIFLLASFALQSCSNPASPNPSNVEAKGEYIFRRQEDASLTIDPMMPLKRPLYPWEEPSPSCVPKITKYFFRCKGNNANPIRIVKYNDQAMHYYDCGGAEKHRLPLKNDQEFIYPILIDLLNHIQQRTAKQVIITSGHCCYEHLLYSDLLRIARTSKHLIGAEVDFYVRGMEQQPEEIVGHLLSYYSEHVRYKTLKEFREFERYAKNEGNLKTIPWYNKEIFIKILRENEGRDFDNCHPYPYISIQVRYDWDLKTNVPNPGGSVASLK